MPSMLLKSARERERERGRGFTIFKRILMFSSPKWLQVILLLISLPNSTNLRASEKETESFRNTGGGLGEKTRGGWEERIFGLLRTKESRTEENRMR